jgi:hypothetical protein
MKTIKFISKILLLAFATMVFVACNKFDDPKPFPPFDPTGKTIITIEQLKRGLWKPELPNALDTREYYTRVCQWEKVTFYEQIAYASELNGDALFQLFGDSDVYIQGRVISCDREGNFFRQLAIQDETTGISIKIGRNGLHNFYKLGQMVYIKLQDLWLGFSRGMYEIGFHPDDLTNFPTSFIDIPTVIDRHIFAGDVNDIQLVKPDTVTLEYLNRNITFHTFTDNTQTQIPLNDMRFDMLMGKLVTIENLKHDSTDSFLTNLYPGLKDGSGAPKCGTYNRRTGVEVDLARFRPKDIIPTWALIASDYQKLAGRNAVENGTQKVVFNNSNNPVQPNHITVDSNGVPLFVTPSTTATISHYFNAFPAAGKIPLIVRTSGFARFAGRKITDIMPEGERRSFTGVIAIYSDRQRRTLAGPDNPNIFLYSGYQLTIRSLDDIK